MAVVNNSGQNFTLYYNVLEYFKTIMQNHPSIAQVSVGDFYGIDDIEFPYYPLGNVLISEANFTTNETQYSVQLTIADKIKLKSNESSGAFNNQTVPFYGVDDTVDIHANTLAILNDLTAYTQRSQTAFLIDDDITCTPFKDKFDNGLAGWIASFTLKTHNDRNMCLFDLNPITSTTTSTTTAGPRFYYEAGKYECVDGNCNYISAVNISNATELNPITGSFRLDPLTGFIYETLGEIASGSYTLTQLSGTGSAICNGVVCTTTTTSTSTTTTAAPTTTTTSTTSTTSTTTTTTAAPTTTTTSTTSTTTTSGPTTTTTQSEQIWAMRPCGTSDTPTVFRIPNSAPIVAGKVYHLSGSSFTDYYTCYEALSTAFTENYTASVISTFDDCATCQSSSQYVYYRAVSNIDASIPDWTIRVITAATSSLGTIGTCQFYSANAVASTASFGGAQQNPITSSESYSFGMTGIIKQKIPSQSIFTDEWNCVGCGGISDVYETTFGIPTFTEQVTGYYLGPIFNSWGNQPRSGSCATYVPYNPFDPVYTDPLQYISCSSNTPVTASLGLTDYRCVKQISRVGADRPYVRITNYNTGSCGTY